ncbi:MAG: hypothetical protein LQ344_000072 [Seirophora lacunosa]|nr:MAG: hypothetical protein LQ344_000072 [Seirophora lacunosa]
MATKSVHTAVTASSLRTKEATLRTRGTAVSSNIPNHSPTWRDSIRLDASTSAQPLNSIPSIPEGVDSHKHRRNDLYPPASQASLKYEGSSRYNHRPPSALTPHSAAAVSRATSYRPYQRPPSQSRSHVPDPMTDWLRIRREANQGVRLRKDEYKLGMIIRAPLHEQDSRGDARALGSSSSVGSNASEATLAEKYTTPSRFGAIFTKYRKMIVVACHQDNYVAIPLYTHNGNGLVYKARPDEFVSVKDHRDKDEEWQPLSRWKPLVTEYVREGIDIFERKTTAHLAYPVSRSYRLPVVKEGFLKGSSAKAMRDLYERFAAIDD